MVPISRKVKVPPDTERIRDPPDEFLGRQRTRDRHDGNDHEKAPDQHAKRQRGVVPIRIGGQARKGAAVVPVTELKRTAFR